MASNDADVLEAIFNPEHPIGFAQPPPSNGAVTVDVSQEVKDMETTAVNLAEQGNLNGALEQLNSVIESAPEYSSAYNNRAQVFRLMGSVDKALLDLNKAIKLSGGQGKAAEQAYTQRGLILMLQGKEDEALEDFKMSASLGSRFAQSQVVKLNPYAKLCNKMLSEAIGKLSDYTQ